MTLSRYQSLRRLALAVLITLVFAAFLLVRSAWGEEGHEAIEIAGMALISIGIVGRMWCTLYIGGHKSKDIIDSGPYSVTRNPLYLFSSIAAGGVGAQTGSLMLGLLCFAASVAAFSLVIRREERHLGGLFGAAYEAYKARVPRFWPSPRLFSDSAKLDISTSRLYRTLGDGLVFFLAVPAFEFVEMLQHGQMMPTVLSLY